MSRPAARRALAALSLAAATSVAAAPAAAHAPAGARGGGPILRAAPSPATLVAARQRFFGRENVDPRTGAVRRDRVILSWFGVTNFAMAIRGHVVLLDAWVPRGGTSGYVPTSPGELADLRPELIFIGHAHFDHAADATPLALATGATLVGDAEQCADLQARAGAAMPPRCVAAIPAGAAPGTRRDRDDLVPGVRIAAVKHLHSAVSAPGNDPTGLHVPVLPPPSTTQLEHPPTSEDLLHLVGHLPDAEDGTVLYRFAVGDLALVWNDSAGPLVDDAPQALGTLRALRPVDVHVGAIQGFGQFTNGMRDVRRYIEEIGAPLFVPAHHDDWAAGITTKGENYRAPLDAELARIPAARRPQLRFISDPADYVRPEALTFPARITAPALTRRCLRGGRLRVALAGDVADVTRVVVRAGGRRVVLAGAPFTTTLPRRAVRALQRRRITATLTDRDGTTAALHRDVPRCGAR